MTYGEREAELRTWYRHALARRAATLETLVPGIETGDNAARQEARAVARALEGSGGTFGFPDVSETARMVAYGADDALLPRVVGFIDALRELAADGALRSDRTGRWLLFAAGPLPEAPEGGAVLPGMELAEAWKRAADRLGVDEAALARRMASRLGVDVADPADTEHAAGLVVPPGLALEHGVLPLRDDGARIVAGSANPTDVLAMAALERGTGRTARLEVLPPAALEAALGERYGRGVLDGPPEHGAPRRPLHAGARPGGGRRPATVLVVDDDPETRLLCRTALQRDGLTVVEAADGTAAMEILDGPEEVDAALVDVLMPGMGGRELLRAVREHPTRRLMPVVVLTGLQSPETEVRLVEEGADDYLRKPVEPRVLLARIHACLRRSGAAGTP